MRIDWGFDPDAGRVLLVYGGSQGSLAINRVIAEWIASGMPGPSANDPEVQSLVFYPPVVRLKPGDSQQVLVQATYSDGRVEDVTRWAKFTSTDDSVARVVSRAPVEPPSGDIP